MSPASEPTDLARIVRLVALITPLLFLCLSGVMLLVGSLFGVPPLSAFLASGPLLGSSLAGMLLVLPLRCRDEAEYRAVRNPLIWAGLSLIATYAILAIGLHAPVGRVVGGTVAAVLGGLFGALVGHGRWLAREI